MEQQLKADGNGSVPPGSNGGQSDAALLEAVRAGDHDAYRELVNRLFPAVYRVASRVLRADSEAEDVAQDVFLKIWRDTPVLRSNTSLRSWCMRVATNGAIDRLRRRKPELRDELPEREDNSVATDEALTGAEAAQSVQQAIDGLPERQRLALTLTYYEGLANKETADLMGVSVDALESLLSRARRGLKASLADTWGDLLEDLGGAAASEGNWSALA